MNKRALITGATGQDGALLSQFLLSKGYQVYGMMRRTSSPTDWRLQELGVASHTNFQSVSGDLTDAASLQKVMAISMPDEIYNLAAQSYVGTSWQNPISTMDITGMGAMRLYEAALHYQQDCGKKVKIYQASSSEMFGNIQHRGIADETEPLYPRSPYGVAKCTAHLAAKTYRDSYGMFISCGILFNHESEYRGIEFVTRKVSLAAARISLGKENVLSLGNISSVRDWGYAPDYIEAMYLMLQQNTPDDYVIATGYGHSIEDLCQAAFSHVGLNWRDYVVVSDKLSRPNDINYLLGDTRKAYIDFGWVPTTKFNDMVVKMVNKDLERVKAGIL